MNDPQAATDVALAPAPWSLVGRGFIFALWMPRDVLEHGSFIPSGLVRHGRGRLAYAMFVDYASSDVGPYRELLYIPGRLRFGNGRHDTPLSITRIFVSTQASVINGRINWGIPKDRCDFALRRDVAREQIRLQADGGGPTFAQMDVEAFGPRLPAPLGWTPRAWRRLSQLREGRRYTYVPEARGHFRLARVHGWQFEPRMFPDLARGRLLAALEITDFTMRFPVAEVQPAVVP